MTDKVPAVYSAISAVMAHVAKDGIGKDRKNTQQGYKFRGIDDVYNTLCGVLAENKLMMLPYVQNMQREERQTKGGGVLNYTILTIDFKLVSAVDGSHDIVRMIGEAMDSADKSSNKAQSAALKYAALQVFMIPTEGDNDADASHHEVAPKQAKPDLISKAQWSRIIALLESTQTQAAPILSHFKVDDLKKLTAAQAIKAINQLEDRLAGMVKDESNKSLAEALDDEIPGFD